MTENPQDQLITVPAKVLYRLRTVDGGESGECYLCGKSWWTDDNHRIKHADGCKVGEVLGNADS